ncbi:MAG: hypothetical protein AAF488_17260 [Planctomycetota bacterium]
MTTWITGLDEAGYGPLLGPLVVGLSTLRSEEPLTPRAPWKLLAPTVCKRRGARGVAVADSKSLHKPSTGDLSPLEEGVLAFVTAERGGETPSSFRELLSHLTEGRIGYLDDYPWYAGRDLELPASVHSLALKGAATRVARVLERRSLAITEVRAIPLDVLEFNQGVLDHGSKHEVNAGAMGRFLQWLWRMDRPENAVFTDRLGGKERYGPFLQPLFPEGKLRIVEQAKQRQAYEIRCDAPDRRLTVHFEMGGEDRCFNTALASMTAKYVRELHMRLFNSWWQEHSPVELNPTAGYYQDAKRFLEETRKLRAELRVEDRLLIRQR